MLIIYLANKSTSLFKQTNDTEVRSRDYLTNIFDICSKTAILRKRGQEPFFKNRYSSTFEGRQASKPRLPPLGVPSGRRTSFWGNKKRAVGSNSKPISPDKSLLVPYLYIRILLKLCASRKHKKFACSDDSKDHRFVFVSICRGKQPQTARANPKLWSNFGDSRIKLKIFIFKCGFDILL